ncbi:ABC transporter ATP-binding protein [Streptomyces radicis]|uniref:ABC transporter ATP-binding protein n=1 Tax=Streptomyces radicis TaxID=1750517 RepID=A0A3A9W9M0_9ACTN|nr:ABC transporter ATP-binding protein [Streptomyces radicis]RKN04256.1 ABC transporter ATP-binding protein [Streptomyces radicis]RKN14774.1 ABC transporter ATP-binding protein [Streptomyces radicis]
MGTPAIEVQGLTREYRTSTGLLRRTARVIPALRGITLTVEPGEIFGLVGPNGAGKTTLIKILTTLLLPTSGQARVLGYDVVSGHRRIRRSINFVYGGERGLYWRLSAEDNLRYFADLYQVPLREANGRVRELLELVGLDDRRQERVEGFSKGMKQRLHLAKSLINRPRVLFLDEPSIGLDPVAARQLRVLVERVRSESGTTILLTSHYMWEMETLSDRIAVLIDGSIRHLDSPQGLRLAAVGSHVVELVLGDDAREETLRAWAGRFGQVVSATASGRRLLQVHTSRPDELNADLATRKLSGIAHFATRDSQLEDAYVLMVEGA